MDSLRTILVAWIIGGHALLGYSAIGGWAYDEVNEVTFAPTSELVLAALLGPTALFLMGTFFLVAGLFTPGSLDRKGPRRFARGRALRLGLPFAASALVLWPASLWFAYWSAGESVSYWWLLSGRNRHLDSGALWFAEVLLIFSLGYLLWHRMTGGAREGGPRRSTIGSMTLLTVAGGIAATTFLVRLVFPARDTQIGDLHLWQWPQLATMFGFGIVSARHGLAERVPDRLRRTSGLVTVCTVLTIPFIALGMGVDNLARDVGPFLGGWRSEALVVASAEAMLVVFGSIWLLGVAQRTFSGTGRFSLAAAHSSFAAFILQGPVLIALSVALRPMAAPAEVKAPLVAALGILVCFGLGWIVVKRTALGRFL